MDKYNFVPAHSSRLGDKKFAISTGVPIELLMTMNFLTRTAAKKKSIGLQVSQVNLESGCLPKWFAGPAAPSAVTAALQGTAPLDPAKLQAASTYRLTGSTD